MKRLIPTAVASFAVLMLMFRGLQQESGTANAAVNNSTSLDVADQVMKDLGYASATTLPPILLVAIIGMVLALGYAAVK